MSNNGETKLSNLSTEEKLDLLLEGLAQVSEQIDELREEVAEKFANLSTPGTDYEVLDEN